MTIDPALPGGDALAAVVTGTASDGRVYILDRMTFNGDLEEGLGILCDMMVRNNPDVVGCETFAFQQMYKLRLEEKIEERKLNFFISETGKDTQRSKATRIKSLQPKIKLGKILFRKCDSDIVDQLLSWNPNSKHNVDDLIDALAWQVPLWDTPLVEESSKDKTGTFQEVLDKLIDDEDDDEENSTIWI